MADAIKYYNRAVILYYFFKDYSAARQDVEAALTIRSDYARAQGLAQRLEKMTRSVEIEDDYEAVRAWQALLQDDWDQLSVLLLVQRGPRARTVAQIDWDPYLAVLEGNQDVLALARRAMLQGQVGRAQRICQQAVHTVPGAGAYHFELGLANYLLEDWAGAEQHLLLALRLGTAYRFAVFKILAYLPMREQQPLWHYAVVRKAAKAEDALALAQAISTGWDPVTLRAFLKRLSRCCHVAEDLITVGSLYLKEVDWRGAQSAFAKAVRVAPNCRLEIIRIIAQEPGVWPSTIPRFLKTLCRALRAPAEMLQAAQCLQQRLPAVALELYQQLEQRDYEPGQVLLGLAQACYYAGDEQGARAHLARLRACSTASALQEEAALFESQILARAGRVGEAIEVLTHLGPQQSFAVGSQIRRLIQECCPVCGAFYQELCPQCHYQRRDLFEWNGQQLVPCFESPGARLTLLSSTTELYQAGMPIDLVLMTWGPTRSADLLLRWDEQTSHVSRLELAGFQVYALPDLPGGNYRIFLDSDPARQYAFSVGMGRAASLSFSQPAHRFTSRGLELDFRITGLDKQPWHGRLHCTLNDMQGNTLMQWRQKVRRGHFYKRIALAPAPRALVLRLQWHRQVEEVLPLPGPLPLLAPRPLASCTAMCFSPQVHPHASPCQGGWYSWAPAAPSGPIMLRQAIGIQAHFEVRCRCEQVIIITQQVGTQAQATYRYNRVAPGVCLSVPIPAPAAFFFLGVTRFDGVDHSQQAAGFMAQGILLHQRAQSLGQLVVTPAGQGVRVRLEAQDPVSGYCLLRPPAMSGCALQRLWAQWIYNELQPYDVSRDGEKTTGGLQPQEQEYGAAVLPLRPSCMMGRADYWQHQCQRQISLPLPAWGTDLVVEAMLSDGEQLEHYEIPVWRHGRVKLHLPSHLASQEEVVTRLEYDTAHATRLCLSQEGQVLWQQTVTGRGQGNFTLSAPGRVGVELGDQVLELEIARAGWARVMAGSLIFLAEGCETRAAALEIYPTPWHLAIAMARALLQHKAWDCVEKAAQLYALAFIYRLGSRLKLTLEQLPSELEVRLYGRLLAAMANPRMPGRWSLRPDRRPQPNVSALVLRYLAPYLQMPKFAQLQQLARVTLQACHAWKIQDHQLLPLDPDFAVKRLANPEAAAAEILYGNHLDEALDYLKQTCQMCGDEAFWQGTSLGGPQETTARVLKALYRTNEDLWRLGWRYLLRRWPGSLTCHAFSTTIAWLDLLDEYDWPCPQLAVNGQVLSPLEIITAAQVQVQQGQVLVRPVHARWVDQWTQLPRAPFHLLKLRPQGLVPRGSILQLTMRVPRSFQAPLATIWAPASFTPLQPAVQGNPWCQALQPGKNTIFWLARYQGRGAFLIMLTDRYHDELALSMVSHAIVVE